jgi:hypothetical protein
MTRPEMIIYWFLSVFAALAIICGKLGLALFGLAQDSPDDAVAAAHWRRKRRWLAYSELSALPAFATIGVTTTIYWHLPAVVSVLISMLLGALGFGFLLNAAVFLAKRKLGMPQ